MLPTFFRGIIVNVAEVNQQCYLEESGQWIENVDQTHLVLDSGKASATKKSCWVVDPWTRPSSGYSCPFQRKRTLVEMVGQLVKKMFLVKDVEKKF